MTTKEKTVIMSCKGCVFANKIGITQVGCDLNKIERFKEIGTKVLEGTDDIEEFYILSRICQFYRDEKWSEGFTDLEEQVHKETEVRCGFIVVHQFGTPIEDIRTTFKGIQAQESPPLYVTLVVDSKEKDPFNIRHICHEYFDWPNVDPSIRFNVVTMMGEDDYTELDMIDEAFLQSHNGYYAVFESGKEVPTDFITSLNKSINEKLDQLSMVRPKDGTVNGLTVQCVVHKFLAGSKTMPLSEKIEIFAEETNRSSFIKDWDEVYG